MQAWLDKIKGNPVEFLLGICVLMIAASGGALHNTASASIGIIFIVSLFYLRHWKSTWQMLDKTEKWLLIGFALYTVTALFSWVNASDHHEFVRQFGRYIRFALIIPVYLMLRTGKFSLGPYLLSGIVLSGFLYFGASIHSTLKYPNVPATGYYHHITFGDAEMLNVGLMGVMLLFYKWKPVNSILITISMICGLYAVLMSEARGAWIILPLYLLVAMAYLFRKNRAAAVKMLVACVIAALLVMLSPLGTVIKTRYDQAITDVTQYDSGVQFDTSLGQRFAYWKIGYQVWKKHPFVGTGLGDFDNDIRAYQAKGEYPNIEVNESAHNIFVQAFVGTGSIGGLALIYALLIAPLVLFKTASRETGVWAVMGVMLVVSYAVFGLSESWILRAPVVAIYLMYMVLFSAYTKNTVYEDS